MKKIGIEGDSRGANDSELKDLEEKINHPLPKVFQAYLKRMGALMPESYSCDNFSLKGIDDAIETAKDLLTEVGREVPKNWLPFVHHHGYDFLFIILDQDDNGPVFHFLEGEKERELSGSFTSWFRESLINIVEYPLINREWNEQKELFSGSWKSRSTIIEKIDHKVGLIRKNFLRSVESLEKETGFLIHPTEVQTRWLELIEDHEILPELKSQNLRTPWGWVQ